MKLPLLHGLKRREFLQIGALGLGGLTFADAMRLEAHGAASTAKSVIMVYLPGGPRSLDPENLLRVCQVSVEAT